ncbi:MAG TPA: amino acid racemase [Bacteroidales bacterium]|nr:amino acid racemase [Bacteroidales bacterium]
MPKHIGIVACSYEGAALCYRTICNEGSKIMGEHAHPEVSLHNHPLSEYMRFIDSGNWQGVADIMLSSSEKLHKAGADILISPDNTIHQAFSHVMEKSPLPWLHIGEEVSKEAEKNGHRRLLILGTKFLMEGPVYPEVLKKMKIDYFIPEPEQRVRINEIIFNQLVYGVIKEDSKRYFLEIVDEFRLKGCDAVVLGCTEIPLIVLPDESSMPVLDSTRILARAALRHATG